VALVVIIVAVVTIANRYLTAAHLVAQTSFTRTLALAVMRPPRRRNVWISAHRKITATGARTMNLAASRKARTLRSVLRRIAMPRSVIKNSISI
jgi:hypothetical protein